MKFVVSSSTFFARLQAVSKVISAKPVQPILDNILLVAKDGVLYAGFALFKIPGQSLVFGELPDRLGVLR